jgi:hypothetical protein
MAKVSYFDAAWVTSPSLQGGDRMSFVLSGVSFGTAVGPTVWCIGQGGAIVQVENFQVTAGDLIQFDVVNVGPIDSLVDGLNLAFSLISQ